MKIKISLTTITLVFIFTHMILGDKLTYCLLVPFNTSYENKELNSLLIVGVLKERKNGDLDLYFKYAVPFDSHFLQYSHFLYTIC